MQVLINNVFKRTSKHEILFNAFFKTYYKGLTTFVERPSEFIIRGLHCLSDDELIVKCIYHHRLSAIDFASEYLLRE